MRIANWKEAGRHSEKPWDQAYRDKGWTNWNDFLVTKRRIGGWLPFKQARAAARRFAQQNGITSFEQWRTYRGKLPARCPASTKRRLC